MKIVKAIVKAFFVVCVWLLDRFVGIFIGILFGASGHLKMINLYQAVKGTK
jgi:hypothetical protein